MISDPLLEHGQRRVGVAGAGFGGIQAHGERRAVGLAARRPVGPGGLGKLSDAHQDVAGERIANGVAGPRAQEYSSILISMTH